MLSRETPFNRLELRSRSTGVAWMFERLWLTSCRMSRLSRMSTACKTLAVRTIAKTHRPLNDRSPKKGYPSKESAGYFADGRPTRGAYKGNLFRGVEPIPGVPLGSGAHSRKDPCSGS